MAIKDRPKLKAFLVNTLRKASYRWPSRYKALKKYHIGRNEYYCASCGIIHGRREGSLDHIDPVIDPKTGWVDLDVYADRMFPETEEQWQRLCHDCHDEKTSAENEIRRANRKPKKKKKKT